MLAESLQAHGVVAYVFQPTFTASRCYTRHTFWNSRNCPIRSFVLLGLEEGFSDPLWNGAVRGGLLVEDPVDGGALRGRRAYLRYGQPSPLPFLPKKIPSRLTRAMPLCR